MAIPAYALLALAIAAEVAGTLALKLSEGFSRPIPSLVVVAGYGSAFYLLSLTLKSLPVGVVYALWAGIGVALVKIIGIVFLREPFSALGLAGVGLIVAGVIVLQLSGEGAH